MATVIRNADNTVTVTFTAAEQRAIAKRAQSAEQTPVQLIAHLLTGRLAEWIARDVEEDGLTRQQKYQALAPEQQAQVDAILNTAVVL